MDPPRRRSWYSNFQGEDKTCFEQTLSTLGLNEDRESSVNYNAWRFPLCVLKVWGHSPWATLDGSLAVAPPDLELSEMWKHTAPSGLLSRGGRRHDLVEPNQHLEVTVPVSPEWSRALGPQDATPSLFLQIVPFVWLSEFLYFMSIKWKCGPLPERPLDESERGEWKSWLKAQHSANKDHGIWSHHFMGNRWGNSENSDRLYFWGAPKSLQMVTAAMKFKDTCSL